MQIIYLDTVHSTQKYLKEKITTNELQAPIAVSADLQTDGIGSRENKWISKEGNLFLSFAIKKSFLPEDLKLESASIYFSYILKETLQELGSNVWIKWPNDFYFADKKIGGTITNLVQDIVICGIGLNSNSAPEAHASLDIAVEKKKLLENYFKNIEKKVLWKQVFSKYKLEFYKNQNFYTHINKNRVSLRDAKLSSDGSLEINGERVYGLR